MIALTQRSETGQEYRRFFSNHRQARTGLFEVIESLRNQGILVLGDMRKGYQTVIDGLLIEFTIEGDYRVV